MSDYIKEYEFKIPPKEIIYGDEEPLKLSNEFSFYHNKNIFRKELNRLQNLFLRYLKTSLVAAGIRDSYLKEIYSENHLIIIFTDNKIVKETNQIIEAHSDIEILSKCFYLESSTKYMLLISKDMDGLISGIDTMEEIFTQTFEEYFSRKKFDEYIKICPFKITSCAKSS
ncbi:MAG: hypothetical protein EU529_09315 [Promethearchaeota archaeon]|nr:MAG: hypothetical protein EU529_09315 [Candidatus Lokiarchaeota archaeon]